MDLKRWMKICWEEIKRGVKNEMATEWGRRWKEEWQDLAENGEEW